MQQIPRRSTSLEREATPYPPAPPSPGIDEFFGQDPPPPSPPTGFDEEDPLPGPMPVDNNEDRPLDDLDRPGNDEFDQVPPTNPLPDNFAPPTDEPIVLDDIIESIQFIKAVEDATLESSRLSAQELDELRNPRAHLSTPSNDPDLLLSISCFVDLLTSSQEAYDKICANIRRRDPTIEMLSYDRVKRSVHNLSGVLVWEDDMCIDTCAAFTGPFADLESCPRCGQPRYDPDKLEKSGGKIKVPRRKFAMFPVGLQIQAHWKYPEMAKKMLYQQTRTNEGETGDYDDVFSGKAYLDAVDAGTIKEYNTLLMFSIDSAQLY